jgi:hypothetical protein
VRNEEKREEESKTKRGRAGKERQKETKRKGRRKTKVRKGRRKMEKYNKALQHVYSLTLCRYKIANAG